MTTWMHKGIEIELNGSTGNFVADIGGKRAVASSLAAMKTRIDKQATVGFEPFDIITDSFGEAVVRNIVGLGKTRQRFGGSPAVFVDERGMQHKEVWRDTPETRAAYDHWQKVKEENDVKIEALRDAIDSAYEAIPVVKASEFKP